MNDERVPPITEGVLFTDQYQLTMAQLYFYEGLAERRAQFDYFFRRYPDYGEHQAGYCIFAGLGWLLHWMESRRFEADDLDRMRAQETSRGAPLFDESFLDWLATNGDFSSLSVRAVPEGRVVHAHAPALVVEGPLALAQILETSLLNHLNYQTLVATKASRVKEAARGSPVLEFGLRRGPAMGANAGARAALIGGADSTSNVGLAHALGFDPKGTHAHSMVQVFMALGLGELGAFRAYADVYPDDCILLVDTIDTLGSGIPNAITVFEELRAKGHQPGGIRLDSGDLAYLSIQAARLLNDAGFADANIVLSSDLDELAIWQILSQIDEEAPGYGVDPGHLASRMIYGVGTRLITSHGDAALGGVYKLVALDVDGVWEPSIKISDTQEKMPIPGDKRIYRIYDSRGLATADVVAAVAEELSTDEELVLHHPYREGVYRVLGAGEIGHIEPLLVEAYLSGKATQDSVNSKVSRGRRDADVARLDPGVRRLVNPHVYHVSLTESVKELQLDLAAKARAQRLSR